MISILDMILIILIAILLFVSSIVLIILPFSGLETSFINNIFRFVENIQGNYFLLLTGIVLLLISIKLFSILFKKDKVKNKKFITKWTDYGEIMISSNTIIGLVDSIISKFSSLKDTDVDVFIDEGKLLINLSGKTTPETNIPEIMEDLQKKIKEHVEQAAGVEVSEVKIYINSVTQPIRTLR